MFRKYSKCLIPDYHYLLSRPMPVANNVGHWLWGTYLLTYTSQKKVSKQVAPKQRRKTFLYDELVTEND